MPARSIFWARCWFNRSVMPEGLSYLEKAQHMTPDSWATYFYMGKAQFQQHDTAAAVRLLRQAVDMNPEDPGSFYLLARALRSEGHVQEADAAMQRVVQLHTSRWTRRNMLLKTPGWWAHTSA